VFRTALAAIAALAMGTGGGASPPGSASETGPRPPSSSVPTAAFAPDGALWLAWVDGPHVYVSSSGDLGRTFTGAIAVNRDPEAIDANGEARPKIAVGPRGEVYVSYTRKGERPFTGDIRFSRRLADGRFSAPLTVNDDRRATGHRFDALAVARNGDVHLFWIDKRDLDRAKAEGRAYEGAALYHALSTDGGRTFTANRNIKDGVCECCRLAIAWEGEVPVVFWRDIMSGSVRDHAIARLEASKETAIVRATDDGWQIDGCPHHGPALAVATDGTWHLAWFTGAGSRGAGTFYRRAMDHGRTLTEPTRIGSERASRPAIAVSGKSVWLAWKEAGTDGAATTVRILRSSDGGLTWSDGREVAHTNGASDHPMVLVRGSRAFLSWFTAAEGYRLLPAD
jgi:hypothetical protein